MKLMKTKLGLSALALACVGAGVMSLQSSVTAKAADEIDTTGFTMANGAAVCLEDDFSGIRWTTTVTKDFYARVSELGSDIKFGVVVAPADAFTGELTHATTLSNGNVKDLPAPQILFTDEDSISYYSVIDYNDIWEDYQATSGSLSETEVLKQAYAMELTARAYVSVDGAYSYADISNISTSRSARQVAVAADLAGDVEEADQEKAREYYGAATNLDPAEKSTGAVGTAVVDLNDVEKDVDVTEFTIDGTIEEVLIGAESVEYNKSGTTLTIKEAAHTTAGEQYVTVFTDGNIYTKPIVVATKVLTQASDLELFHAKGTNGTHTTKVQETVDGVVNTYYENGEWSAEQEQSGYYVLGQNIEAEGYVHGSKNTDGEFNNADWQSASNYKNLPIGLTGTFNGMGYAIKDMEIGSQKEGLFGIVNGGTVKNVAFTDVKAEDKGTQSYMYVLAFHLYNATIENVYIRTDEYVADADSDGVAESKGFPMRNCSALVSYAAGKTSLTSCVIEYSTSNEVVNIPGGLLFDAYHDSYQNGDLKMNNVYCVSANLISSKTHTLMYLKKSTKPVTVLLAENETDATNINIHAATNYPRGQINGVYRYDTLADMVADTTYYSFANLASSCWTEVGGSPVWTSLQA